MFKCGICGKESDSLKNHVDHVNECAKLLLQKEELESERKHIKEVNAALVEVKRSKICYEGLLENFKNKYPKEYEINFKQDTGTKKDIIQLNSFEDFLNVIDKMLER